MAEHIDFIAAPERMPEAMKARRTAAAHALAEARTYAQMLANVPLVALEGEGDIIDTNGMMSLGTNLLHDLTRAAVAQIVKPLTARVVPIGGTRETLNSCTALGQMIDGAIESTGFHDMAELVVTQAAVVPHGGHILVEVDPIRKDIVPEVLSPTDTFINYDRSDVIFDRFMSKRRARARWGKNEALKAAINLLPFATPEVITGVDQADQWNADDLVRITEAYVTPMGDEPGKHFVYFNAEHIIEEAFTLPMIPIASMIWSHGFRGASFGAPMARQVAGAATWQKKLYWRLWDSAIACVPWIRNAPKGWKPLDVPHQLVPAGKDGKPIEVTFPPAFSDQIKELAEDIDTRAAKTTGIVEGEQGSSAPPSTLTSGVAISSWTSVRNEALSPQHHGFDGLYSQFGKIYTAYGPTVYASKKAVMSARGTEVIRQINWAELALPEKDGFQLSFDVVSGMGSHVPQKIQMLELALEKGAIDVGQYFAMLDFPDFRAAAKRLGGPRAFIEFQIDQALSHGELVPPSLMQDKAQLESLVKAVAEAYLAERASRVPAPKENLTKLRLLWRLAKARLENAGGASPPAVAAGAPLPSAGTELPALDAGITPGPAQALPIDAVGLPPSDAALEPTTPPLIS